MDKDVIVTKHATKRMRQRIGVNKGATEELARKALSKGVKHHETSGPLKAYLDSVFFRNNDADNLRVYGDKVFIFSGNSLVTVLNLPNKYRKTALAISKNDRMEKLTVNKHHTRLFVTCEAGSKSEEREIQRCASCTYFRGTNNHNSIDRVNYMTANPKIIYCAHMGE